MWHRVAALVHWGVHVPWRYRSGKRDGNEYVTEFHREKRHGGMHPTAHPALSDPTTITLVERKVAALRQSWRLPESDADDIRQDIYLDLAERLPQHDPAKSRIALFVAACVHRKIFNVVRGMLAQRRSPVRDSTERMQSALDFVGAEISSPAAEQAGQREIVLRDLRLDLAAATQGLTKAERDLMRDLMSESVSDIARRTGRTRKMVYRVFGSLRLKLARAGLRQYVAARDHITEVAGN